MPARDGPRLRARVRHDDDPRLAAASATLARRLRARRSRRLRVARGARGVAGSDRGRSCSRPRLSYAGRGRRNRGLGRAHDGRARRADGDARASARPRGLAAGTARRWARRRSPSRAASTSHRPRSAISSRASPSTKTESPRPGIRSSTPTATCSSPVHGAVRRARLPSRRPGSIRRTSIGSRFPSREPSARSTRPGTQPYQAWLLAARDADAFTASLHPRARDTDHEGACSPLRAGGAGLAACGAGRYRHAEHGRERRGRRRRRVSELAGRGLGRWLVDDLGLRAHLGRCVLRLARRRSDHARVGSRRDQRPRRSHSGRLELPGLRRAALRGRRLSDPIAPDHGVTGASGTVTGRADLAP